MKVVILIQKYAQIQQLDIVFKLIIIKNIIQNNYSNILK